MPTAYSIQLALHCKKSENIDLKTALVGYVRATYSDHEAAEAADDVAMIQKLRGDVVLAQDGVQPALKDTLAKYFRCLTAVETRFPISKERGHAQISFPWYDAFRPTKKSSQANIHFEKAAILFNLAATTSQQALSCDRTTSEGLLQASKLFQEAAGLFAALRENEASKTDNPRPIDLSSECVTMLEKLMLAQAQECVYHKAVLDKKIPTLLARLAKQTAIMYEETERYFSTQALISYFEKSWVAHVQLKASLYDVETLIQSSKGLRAEDKVAAEIAILTEAFKRVQNTKKVAKGISADMYDTAEKMQTMIQQALAKAEKDNSTIYLERIPPFLDLPAVQGALLVKSIAPTTLDASQENLFTGLIPDSSAKALSKYTDLVDSLTREQLDKLAAATDNARLRLKEWELPDTLEALDARTHASLPDAVLRDLEDIQGIGGVSHLKGILAEIGELRKSVSEDLFASQGGLDADQQQDAECRTKFGDKWRLPAAATVAKPYWDKISSYRTSMQKAGESDQGVMKRLADNEAAFSNLTTDAAAAQMPRLQAPMVSVGPEDPAVVVASLRRNLGALQALASERGAMEEALKDMKKKDNVLPKLMSTNPQAHDALFANELKKYDPLKEDIAKNIQAQDELLVAVDRDNKAFRSIFDVHGWRQACEASALSIRDLVKQYRELLDHLSEGLRFYIGMAEVVKRCRQECQDFSYTRNVQREEVKQDIERRAQQEESERLARQLQQANLHSPPGAPPAAYPPPPGSQQHPTSSPFRDPSTMPPPSPQVSTGPYGAYGPASPAAAAAAGHHTPLPAANAHTQPPPPPPSQPWGQQYTSYAPGAPQTPAYQPWTPPPPGSYGYSQQPYQPPPGGYPGQQPPQYQQGPPQQQYYGQHYYGQH